MEKEQKSFNNTKATLQEEQEKFERESKEKAKSAVHGGKEILSGEMERISGALHSAASRLEQENDTFAGWANNLAARADTASHYLKEKNTKEIFSAIDDFTRKNPGATVGTMFLAGFVFSRFLKAGKKE